MNNEIKKLTQELQDPDWNVRRRAARYLGKHKVPEAKTALLQVLTEENDGDVLEAAILALLKLGSTEMLDLIIKPKIIMSPETSVRWACTYALASLGSIRHFEQLYQFVTDEEWIVRNETISTLEQLIGRIGQTEIDRTVHFEQNLHLLIRMLHIDNKNLQECIIARLVTFDHQAIEQHLIEALETENECIKLGLIKTLGRIRSKTAVPHILQFLSDESPRIQLVATKALGEIDGIQSFNSLIQQLASQNELVVQAAIEGIIRQKKFDYVEASLVDSLNYDTNTHRKKCILTIMGQIRLPSFLKPIFAHLGNSYFLVRKSAAEALLKYGESIREAVSQLLLISEAPIDKLIEEAKSGRPNSLRINAIKALGILKKSEALQCVDELAQVSDPEISRAAQKASCKLTESIWERSNAAFILGELGGEKSIAPLLDAMKDESSRVRWAAVAALRQVKSEKTIEDLVKAFANDTFSEIRREAVIALGDIGHFPDSVKKVLFKATQDKSPHVRLELARVMGKIHDDRTTDALLQYLQDSSYEVRRNARNALYSHGEEVLPQISALLTKTGNSYVKNNIFQLFGMLYAKDTILQIEQCLKKETEPEVIAFGRKVIGILNGKPEDKKVLFI